MVQADKSRDGMAWQTAQHDDLRKGGTKIDIAVIDADLISKRKHRFPNLCCMKISGYHKSIGDYVTLKTDYDDLHHFDKVYISKVFTDTEIPGEPEDKSGKNCETISDWYEGNVLLHQANIEYGGTGFYYDKAPPLPEEIEHAFPDYHLYDVWVYSKINSGSKRTAFKYYLDYSIGYLTRRCFRQCEFCVNRNYQKSIAASSLCEFLDESRPKICLLDDNFFSYPNWPELIQPVIQSGKRFQFKQGLDEKLLTREIISQMAKWKYDGDFIFAFDNIADRELVERKLTTFTEMFQNNKRKLKFYLFCGYDRKGIWDDKFWHDDIRDVFERINILRSYGAIPYIMRYEAIDKSQYKRFYSLIASWCNQPSIFISFPFDIYCKCKGMMKNGYAKYKRDTDRYLSDIGDKGSAWLELERIEQKFPDIAKKYWLNIG